MTQMKNVICIGHRGAKGYEPENTLRSFRKALELGAAWVEFDVWSVQGTPLVFHDHRLERLTNGTGYIPELSLDYLRSLDAGQGEQIPTLVEVLDLLAGRIAMNIELKGEQSAASTMRVVESYLAGGTLSYDQLLISSFNHRELSEIKAIDGRVRIGALLYGVPLSLAQIGSELGAYSMNQAVEFLTPEFLEDTHRRGMQCYVYTVNHEDDIRRVIREGVDGVFSDYPDRVLKVIAEMGGSCAGRSRL